jgi:hypothetical protein
VNRRVFSNRHLSICSHVVDFDVPWLNKICTGGNHYRSYSCMSMVGRVQSELNFVLFPIGHCELKDRTSHGNMWER